MVILLSMIGAIAVVAIGAKLLSGFHEYSSGIYDKARKKTDPGKKNPGKSDGGTSHGTEPSKDEQDLL